MPQDQGRFRVKRKNVLCGILVALSLLLLVIAEFFFRTAPPVPPAPPPPVLEEGGIGIVDLVRAEKAHQAYGQLAELEMQRADIAAALELLHARRRVWTAPSLADEPFRLAAEQKALQQQRLATQAQERERRKALAAWEEETKDAFLAQKKALEDSYRNRLVNIELKLDNREAMRLSEAEIEVLLKELDTLRKERGARLQELFTAREEEKRRFLAALIARDEAAGKSGISPAQEAERHKAEAERRNSEALLQAMQGMEIDELMRRQESALQAKDEEIRIIRAYIRKDIESRAAKLAILYRLTLVVAKETDDTANARREEQDEPALRFSVTAPDARDLTDEVIAELSSGRL